jgi:N-hydroxyarylamine O-acetyltransferase
MAEISTDQIETYLRRIGLTGPLRPTAETLAAIQWAHLHAVPFENLDICPLCTPLALDIASMYEKIVIHKRGGFCFEVNGLLAELLASLGYGVERMGGWFADELNPDPFDHMVLIVTIPGDGAGWYTDVGAGRTNPDRPIPIDGVDDDGLRRTRMVDGIWLAESLAEDGAWNPVLHWSPEPHPLSAFAERCAYFERDPASFFRQRPVATMLRDGGRITLARRSLITTVDGVRAEREIDTNEEIQAILRDTFGIDIPVDNRWR